jgi:hypothetical protein
LIGELSFRGSSAALLRHKLAKPFFVLGFQSTGMPPSFRVSLRILPKLGRKWATLEKNFVDFQSAKKILTEIKDDFF